MGKDNVVAVVACGTTKTRPRERREGERTNEIQTAKARENGKQRVSSKLCHFIRINLIRFYIYCYCYDYGFSAIFLFLALAGLILSFFCILARKKENDRGRGSIVGETEKP